MNDTLPPGASHTGISCKRWTLAVNVIPRTCPAVLAALLLLTGMSVVSAEEASLVGLEETVRIGAMDGEDEFLFGRIVSVATGQGGCVFVADGQLVNIRQFSASGEFLGYVGQKGEGPGEYLEIQDMKALPNGSLAVLDFPHRVILFDESGEYGDDFRVPSTLRAPRMLEVDRQGFVYVKTTMSKTTPGLRDWEFGLLKLSPDGEVIKTVRLPRERTAEDAFVLMTPEGPLWNFVVSTRVAWSPAGYIVCGRNDEYAIQLRSPDGTVAGTLERSMEPAKLGAEERREWQQWAEYMSRGGRPGNSGTAAGIPEIKPFFRDIVVGDAGRVWVDRYVRAQPREVDPRQEGDLRPLLSWREPRTYDVFDEDLTFLGTVVLPEDTRLGAARGNRVWGVEATDQGERLVGFRLVTGAE
jgi:hypothetical protein